MSLLQMQSLVVCLFLPVRSLVHCGVPVLPDLAPLVPASLVHTVVPVVLVAVRRAEVELVPRALQLVTVSGRGGVRSSSEGGKLSGLGAGEHSHEGQGEEELL